MIRPTLRDSRVTPASTLCRAALGLCLLIATVGCEDDDPTGPGGDRGGPTDPEGLVELYLTARSLDDEALPENAAGQVEVAVGETFMLELAYADLRDGGEDSGIFSLAVDLLTDQADRLEPVVSETQQLVFGSELGTAIANDPTGSILFTMEGSGASYSSSGADFANDPLGEIELAMQDFGYTRGVDYEVRQVSVPGGSGGSDIGFRIRWNVGLYPNVDTPDLMAIPEFDDPVSSQLQEFSPVGPDGVTLNQAALHFNVDVASRSYDGGEEFYTARTGLAFDATLGFTGLEVLGQFVPGGIPEAANDGVFLEPFDVLSLPVRVNAPVDGLEIRVTPIDRADAILLYGSDEPVVDDDVWLDEDSRVVVVGS